MIIILFLAFDDKGFVMVASFKSLILGILPSLIGAGAGTGATFTGASTGLSVSIGMSRSSSSSSSSNNFCKSTIPNKKNYGTWVRNTTLLKTDMSAADALVQSGPNPEDASCVAISLATCLIWPGVPAAAIGVYVELKVLGILSGKNFCKTMEGVTLATLCFFLFS
jgi:hypothetical protein